MLLRPELKAAPENIEVTGYVKSRIFLNTDVISYREPEKKQRQVRSLSHTTALSPLVSESQEKSEFLVIKSLLPAPLLRAEVQAAPVALLSVPLNTVRRVRKWEVDTGCLLAGR